MDDNKKKNSEGSNKKRVVVSLFWLIINKARRIFEAQLVKNNDAKLACLKKYAVAANNDLQKFHNAYMEKVGLLTDSVRFCKSAEAVGCDPTILATHIVFLGSATMNRVLKVGLANSGVLKDINLYREPFLPEVQEFAK